MSLLTITVTVPAPPQILHRRLEVLRAERTRRMARNYGYGTISDQWLEADIKTLETAVGEAPVKGPQQPVMGDPAVPPVEAPAFSTADKGSLPCDCTPMFAAEVCADCPEKKA